MAAVAGQRAHARWSASASDRRWACPGSLTLEEHSGVPDKEREAAAWGTACHEVCEKALRNGHSPHDQIGEGIMTSEHDFIVDEEMADCAAVFTEYVRKRLGAYAEETGQDATLLIEQKFSLGAIQPPFESGGTGDAVMLFPAWREVEIVDLKTGRGKTVEVGDNKQLRTYALGAMIANAGPWRTARSTIVQPRKHHADGPVRSEAYDVVDLMEWTSDLLAAMRRAQDAGLDLSRVYNDGASMRSWAAAWLEAGDHCDFCNAYATCPAVKAEVLSHFEVEDGRVQAPPDPDSLSMDQMAKILDAADMIGNWLNAVRARAHDLAEAGSPPPGYILVEKRGRRRWRDEHEAEGALLALLGEDGAYETPKIKSPAQAEKALGAKRKAEVAALIETPVTGKNLVRADKTTRPAIGGVADTFFSIQE